jgi:hypothetical protein
MNKKDDNGFEIRRAVATKIFLESEYYNLYLQPYLNSQIENNNKITKLDEKDLLTSYSKAKAKVDMAQNMKNLFQRWTMIKSEKKGDKNGE